MEARSPSTRWRCIPAPAAATVAALLDMGWQPLGPWHCISGQGDARVVPGGELGQGVLGMADVQKAFAQFIERKLLRTANILLERRWLGESP